MKKSELKKIIRESIKLLTEETNSKDGLGLTTIPPSDLPAKKRTLPPSDLPAKKRTLPEQTGCAPNRAHIVSMACSGSLHWTGNWMPGPWHCQCCKLDGRLPTSADVGQTMSHSYGSFAPFDFTIIEVNPGVSGWNGNMITTPSCPSITTPCDTSPSTACAQQWFQNPNAGWASNWINSKDCTNYTWPAQNLEQQALNIMNQAPNQVPGAMGPYSGYQDIWDAGNNSGLVSPQKERFIAKMAKSMFAQCQLQNCC
jgi:hypothetical protein